MERIKLHQTAEVDVHQVPFVNIDKFNSTLYDIILKEAIHRDKGAWMTEWFNDSFKEVAEYALNYISNLDTHPPLRLPFDRNPIELVELWGQLYNVDDHQESHDHIPSDLSWIYYVNTPDGSAPLMFEDTDKDIPAQAGDLLVFPAWVRHYVPKNNCKGRAIIAGNLKYE